MTIKNAILYADDTTIYLTGRNLRFIKMKYQYDIDQLSMWVKANQFSLCLCLCSQKSQNM